MPKKSSFKSHIQRELVKLYDVSCKLKETYNECQYYMTPDELKMFYEESFFSKYNFCNDIRLYLEKNHNVSFFKSRLRNSFYVTKITLFLFIEKDGCGYLFENALALEEQNNKLLLKLLEEHLPDELRHKLLKHSLGQEKRIESLKNIIARHTSNVLHNN
ncbi:hypothetical protein [Joostella sp.]|uniref:hypothetical protein n=1 Tax=Joostella sp. TaxID=2231138 RepID=UPI003A8FEC09